VILTCFTIKQLTQLLEGFPPRESWQQFLDLRDPLIVEVSLGRALRIHLAFEFFHAILLHLLFLLEVVSRHIVFRQVVAKFFFYSLCSRCDFFILLVEHCLVRVLIILYLLQQV